MTNQSRSECQCQCQCRVLCYSPPFNVILRKACQYCLEMEKFSMREQIVLVYQILSEYAVVACSTVSAQTQKNQIEKPTVSVKPVF